MKQSIQMSAILGGLLLSTAALAGNHAGGHGAHGSHGSHGEKAPAVEAAAQADAAQAEMAQGEVRRVNASTGKITLRHGEIKSLEMPPMTMAFDVEDKAQLEGLKQGDKVMFDAKQEGSKYIVTTIKKAE